MTNGLKTATYKIEDGRDKGKIFEIIEMPAMQADRWAHRLAHEATKSGLDLKAEKLLNLNTESMVGWIEIGLVIWSVLGKIDYEIALDMKYELLKRCVQIVPSSGEPRSVFWEDEIKDFKNFSLIAMEVIKLHSGFLKQGDL